MKIKTEMVNYESFEDSGLNKEQILGLMSKRRKDGEILTEKIDRIIGTSKERILGVKELTKINFELIELDDLFEKLNKK